MTILDFAAEKAKRCAHCGAKPVATWMGGKPCCARCEYLIIEGSRTAYRVLTALEEAKVVGDHKVIARTILAHL